MGNSHAAGSYSTANVAGSRRGSEMTDFPMEALSKEEMEQKFAEIVVSAVGEQFWHASCSVNFNVAPSPPPSLLEYTLPTRQTKLCCLSTGGALAKI